MPDVRLAVTRRWPCLIGGRGGARQRDSILMLPLLLPMWLRLPSTATRTQEGLSAVTKVVPRRESVGGRWNGKDVARPCRPEGGVVSPRPESVA